MAFKTGTILGIFVSVLVIAMIAFGFWYFERMFAKKKTRYGGILMPLLFFLFNLFVIVQSIPATYTQVKAQGYGIAVVILNLLLGFLFINIPTIWVYIVYYRTRRKLGLTVLPLDRKKKSEDAPAKDK